MYAYTCLFASGAVSSFYSERVTEVSTSAVIVIPLWQDGCTPQQLLIYTPEDMVFDQMLVKQYSEIKVQFGSLLEE